MASDDPVLQGEFNAFASSMRERLEDAKDNIIGRLTRMEAHQEMNATLQRESALKEAEERGRTKQRLDDLEARERSRDLKLWGLILLAVGAAVAGLREWLAGIAAGSR